MATVYALTNDYSAYVEKSGEMEMAMPSQRPADYKAKARAVLRKLLSHVAAQPVWW
jgi:hypothetical protein